MNRTLISSGTEWEKKYGYSRAVVAGDLVAIAGTTAVDESGAVIGGDDPYEQAKFVYRKIERALREAGSSLEDVFRVRTFGNGGRIESTNPALTPSAHRGVPSRRNLGTATFRRDGQRAP